MAKTGKRQARAYTDQQFGQVLDYLAQTRWPERNKTAFLLTAHAGLRAGEISQLCWHHVLDWQGTDIDEKIRITDDIAKKGKGREFSMSNDLIETLRAHMWTTPPELRKRDNRIILNQHNRPMTPNAVSHLFHYWFCMELGWKGFSSHSGRRTFITKAARKINLCGGSIYDVSLMVGHSNLQTTQVYIDGNEDAQKKVVNMI